MKTRLIFTSIFAIFTFAAVSYGQTAIDSHTRVLTGTDGGIWRGAAAIYRNVNGTWVELSSDSAVGPSVQAGQTIRLRIASTNNRGQLLVGVDDARTAGKPNGRLFVATNVGVYQVPCEGTATRLGGVSTAQLTITGAISDMSPSWKTEKEWRGTCRMLVLKFRDGNEIRARLRFE